MEETNSKIARLVREELSSTKIMILAVMMSFGLVLSVINFVVDMFSNLDTMVGIKEYLRSPYDLEMNQGITLFIETSSIMQIVMFVIGFIPLTIMAYGVYMLYANAKSTTPKTTGLKVVGGVMKYHGVVAYLYTALIIILGVVAMVAAFGFGDKIAGEVAESGYEDSFKASLKVLSIVFLIIAIIVGIVFAAIGTVYMSLAGNMKFMSEVQYGRRFKRMSAFGVIIMILAGISNFLSIFSGASAGGLSSDDIAMLEEMFGGQVTEMILEIMPSGAIQFEAAVVECAYAFFIGAAQIIAGITLMIIRAKVNHIMQEQEMISYGGDDFTNSN